MIRTVLQSLLRICSEKENSSKILAVLINTGCALLMDGEVAEHAVRRLQITLTMVTTQLINYGIISIR